MTRAPNAVEATVGRVLRLPLFEGVSNAAVERALERFTAIPVRGGDAIVRQGEPADRFYVVESGRYVVRQVDEAGIERDLRQLGPDDVFGELGLLSAAPRTATVIALTDGELLALDGPHFLELVGSPSAVHRRMLQRYEPVLLPTFD